MSSKQIILNPQERLSEMVKKLEHIAKKNKKMSFNPLHFVEVIHTDDSVLFYSHAFFIKEGNFYYVFTEHHGNMFYHIEDVESVCAYTKGCL
jgi:hypothetical protein